MLLSIKRKIQRLKFISKTKLFFNLISLSCIVIIAYYSNIFGFKKTEEQKIAMERREGKIILAKDNFNLPENIEFTELLVKNIDNKDVSLAETMQNKEYIMINFWASWCNPCIKEMQELDDIYNEMLKNYNVAIIPINTDLHDPNIKSKEFYQTYNIKNLPLYSDIKQNIFNQLKATGMPTTIIFDKQGNEIVRFVGYINWNSKSRIEMLKDIFK